MTGWILAALVCRALDAGSSIAAFKAGSQEVVPWMPERTPWVIAVHVGIGSVQTNFARTLAKTHPTRAKFLAALAAGAECTVAAVNGRRR